MRASASPYTMILGAMGLIPFVFATYLSWTNATFFDRSGLYLFITYGAIILSFLSGTLWGQFVHKESSPVSKYLLISSNVVAVAAWFSLLLDIQVLSIALLFLGFISTFWGRSQIRSPSRIRRLTCFALSHHAFCTDTDRLRIASFGFLPKLLILNRPPFHWRTDLFSLVLRIFKLKTLNQ